VAQKRLGHSNVSVTMGIYSHVISEMCLEAAKVIEDLLGYQSIGKTYRVNAHPKSNHRFDHDRDNYPTGVEEGLAGSKRRLNVSGLLQ
jgi:hypothetical protein